MTPMPEQNGHYTTDGMSAIFHKNEAFPPLSSAWTKQKVK